MRTMNLLRRLRSIVRDDRGFGLADALIGSIVNAFSVALIGGSIMVFITLQTGFTVTARNVAEAGNADSMWRSDAQLANSVSSPDADTVSFVIPAPGGACRLSTWTLSSVDGKTRLVDTNTTYQSLNTDTGTPTCAGAVQGGPVSIVVLTDAGPQAGFSFTNISGRDETLTPTPTLSTSQTRPEQTSAADWDSTVVGKAVLTAKPGGGVPLRTAAVTTAIWRIGTTPSAPTTQVN